MFLERRDMSRIFCGVLFISAACGQAFEVASVRASPNRENRREAYHVLDYQVSGPEWMGSTRYDISAKAGEAVKEDQLRVMLRALLAERFKLTLHPETKEMAAFVLVPAKGGIKVHESQTEGEMAVEAGNGKSITLKGVSAEMFLEELSNGLHAPVINKTGLEGRYDATIDIGKYFGEAGLIKDGSDIVSIMLTGLEQDLGLKVESKKLPIELLVVDHAERVMGEN
jgi:uncharacterized protein (TIGR03435 family)